MSEDKSRRPTASRSPAANGQGGHALSSGDAAKLNAFAKRVSSTLGDVVTLMMRARQHRHAFLADLEWMVLPALASGQFAIAEGRHKETGLSAPRAMILWASVSNEVDSRLAANLGGHLRLKPSEWASGQNTWLIEAVGDARTLKTLIERTLAGPLNGRTLKFVTRGEGGHPTVKTMKSSRVSDASPAPKT